MRRRTFLASLAALAMPALPAVGASPAWLLPDGIKYAAVGLPAGTTTGELIITLDCDTSRLQAALDELRLGLESRDVLERFPKGLLAELQSVVAGGAVGELCELGGVLASRAGECRIDIKPGRLLKRAVTALRTLRAQDKFIGHGDLRVQG